MANFALVTDTTADLPKELCEQRNIYMIPQVIVWGRETFKDREDITSREFYKRLASASEMPTTSRPVPVDLANLLQKAHDENNVETVVMLSVSKDVSGTYSSAMEAIKMVDFPVKVLDTRTISLALGMVALKVAEARDSGASPDEAIALAEQLSARSSALFSPGTLEYLRRGGRIGSAQHLIGTALSIKPILTLKDGHVEALESIRTRKRALKRLLDIAEERIDKSKPLHMGVIHGDAEQEAQSLLEDARARWNPELLLSSWVSPSIGVHAGPGVIGITIVQ